MTTENKDTIRLSSFEEQIFLAAKGHYDNQEHNKISALKKAICKLCWIPDTVSDFDIYQNVADVFLKYVQHSHQRDAMGWFFRFGMLNKETVSYVEMTKWMLGAISTIRIVNSADQYLVKMDVKNILDTTTKSEEILDG